MTRIDPTALEASASEAAVDTLSLERLSLDELKLEALSLDDVLEQAAPGARFNKDPWSWITHFAGGLVAIFGVAHLLSIAPDAGPKLPLMALYGASLILMFSTSTLYHFLDIGEARNQVLRKLDHCAIFLLIAGTWMPAAGHLMSGPMRTYTLLGGLAMALAGIAFKLVWIDAPRWLGTGVYVAMGWGAVIPTWHVMPLMTSTSIALLFGGGAFYSVGAIIYGTKKPDPWPGVFGFHEVWHVFVIGGALCHYLWVLGFAELPCPPL